MKKSMEEAILDLLCKKAVYGLTDDEAGELRQLEEMANRSLDSHSLELAAAAISLSGLERIEAMPRHLEAKILASAAEHFSSSPKQVDVEDNVFTAPRRPVVEDTEPKGSFWNWFGWAVAAAACIALAVNVWTSRTDTQIAEGPTPKPTIEAKPSLSELRAQLVMSASDVVRGEWGPANVKEISDVGGDVVWSDTRQEGYMRFRGLPANDPGNEVYQLWIFDETQDEKTPIDGGVFDVTADGEIIIPIDAKLKARNPAAFAVTIEKPGGVVVSSREKIAALAKVAKTS